MKEFPDGQSAYDYEVEMKNRYLYPERYPMRLTELQGINPPINWEWLADKQDAEPVPHIPYTYKARISCIEEGERGTRMELVIPDEARKVIGNFRDFRYVYIWGVE